MTRSILFLIALIGVTLVASAWAAPIPSPRAEIDLSGPWLFLPDKKDVGVASGWFGESFDASAWRRVTIPIAFDDCGHDLNRYGGVGWFRRTVNVPKNLENKRVVLRFEGISYNAVVWLNGQKVGENHDAFLPFDITVSDALRYGADNLIVVRIDNIRRRCQFPLFEGWFGQGGFLREATLVATDPVFVDHVGVRAEPDGPGGSLEVKAVLVNQAKEATRATARVTVTDRDGNPVARLDSESIDLIPGKSSEASLRTHVPNIQWWSPETPVLYTARVDLVRHGDTVDAVAARFGFRRVETKDARLLLNGKPIFLQGFNRHEDSPRTGMAVDLEQAKADFQEMKRMGCNFVRLCHYPHHPGELTLCDELGLLVMAENAMNEWGHYDHPDPNGGFNLTPEDAPLVVENGRRTLEKMVKRDMNHPSVIIFSVGNESAEERPDVVDGNNALVAHGKTLDPTRLWTHVSNSYRKPEYRPAFYQNDDIIAINAYPEHWLGGNEAALQQSEAWFREKAEMIHKAHPHKPIMIGECGWPVDGNDDFQRRVAETNFRAASAPYMAGICFWCFAHHPWPKNTMSNYGYTTRDRKTRYSAMATIERLFKENDRRRTNAP